jgi:hypothetical protein
MAQPLAVVADVQVLPGIGDLNEDDATTAARLLRTASNLVRTRFRDIDARVAAFATPAPGVTPIDPDIVTDVVANMVARVLRNPEGVKAEAIGPTSTTYYSNVSAGYLFLTSDEAAMLAPAPRPSIGTIRAGEGLARHLERRADPELRRGFFPDRGL